MVFRIRPQYAELEAQELFRDERERMDRLTYMERYYAAVREAKAMARTGIYTVAQCKAIVPSAQYTPEHKLGPYMARLQEIAEAEVMAAAHKLNEYLLRPDPRDWTELDDLDEGPDAVEKRPGEPKGPSGTTAQSSKGKSPAVDESPEPVETPGVTSESEMVAVEHSEMQNVEDQSPGEVEAAHASTQPQTAVTEPLETKSATDEFSVQVEATIAPSEFETVVAKSSTEANVAELAPVTDVPVPKSKQSPAAEKTDGDSDAPAGDSHQS